MNAPETPTAIPAPSTGRRVLLVDDNAIQLKLGRLRLLDAGYQVATATGADDALIQAKAMQPDAVVSDVLMGDLDGFGLCRLLRSEPTLADVPVILCSSHYRARPDQDLAVAVGASALVERTPDFEAELAALDASLCGPRERPVGSADPAVYEQQLRTNAKQMTTLLGRAENAEERYRALFNKAHDVITVLTLDGIVIDANERWRAVRGIGPEGMIGLHIDAFSPPGMQAENAERYKTHIARGAGRSRAVPILHADGHTMYMEFSTSVIDVDGNPTVFAIGRDVTQELQAAEQVAAAELKYRSLVERIPDVVWTCEIAGDITFVTGNILRVLGYTPEEFCGSTNRERAAEIHPDDRAAALEQYAAFRRSERLFDIEYRRRHKDGRWIWIRNRATSVYEIDGVRYGEGMLSDISEKRKLEEGLRQAQKMEAIGQLTGGVAHDFNNILAAILANTHFLLEGLGKHDPRRGEAEEIQAAADRAATLTRQLLAFGRRQVLAPTVIDLRDIVTKIEHMLGRLIGEDVDFSVVPSETLGSVRVDVGQLEQVIVNLVVNARDAMPNGGKLTIETTNVDLEVEEPAVGATIPCGKYVMLAVTDTGTGMDAATKQRIFEPFFTTKEVGRGTGLGLSTCYGIVRQSGGHIWVYSEVGHGTVFKIYLPRVDAEDTVAAPVPVKAIGGTETILLVEDDAHVRKAVSRILEARGYRLLVAANGSEALALAEGHDGPVHLLLSDVVMPGANGPEVVSWMRERSSNVKALLMSGYTDHEMLRTGALQPGVSFIQKPFAPEALVKKVREVLDV